MLSLNRDTRSEYRCSGDFVSSYPTNQSTSRNQTCVDGGALCSLCHYVQFGSAQARGGNCE